MFNRFILQILIALFSFRKQQRACIVSNDLVQTKVTNENSQVARQLFIGEFLLILNAESLKNKSGVFTFWSE